MAVNKSFAVAMISEVAGYNENRGYYMLKCSTFTFIYIYIYILEPSGVLEEVPGAPQQKCMTDA